MIDKQSSHNIETRERTHARQTAHARDKNMIIKFKIAKYTLQN